jgi:hypothetical protein
MLYAPSLAEEIAQCVVRMVEEDPTWGSSTCCNIHTVPAEGQSNVSD